jgi:lipid-binding SYLF domain-containing protein
MRIEAGRWKAKLAFAGMTVLALAFVGAAQVAASTSDKADDVSRIQAAARVFRSVMAVPGKGIPRYILKHATCIAIIPGEKKAAFGIGANYGKGVAMCKTVAGRWGAPMFITIGGGSWGLQIGASSSDVIMVFGNRSQLNSLLSSKFRVGAEAAAAAGPVGRNVAAGTDVKLNSEILTYGRSKGAFAGISISGAVVQPDNTGNVAMYGKGAYDYHSILKNQFPTPPSARPLIRALNQNEATAPPTRKHSGGAR